jgi:4-hydroxy-tetrahydrodipicolinate reductase
MSQGVTVLDSIVRQVAASLGPEFAVEIHETHHIHKLDSPSGTALKLAESVAAGKGVALDDAEIQFEVERRGEVPGDHSVVLTSPTETLTFKHSVTTRQVFADGALRAARWAVAQNPGWYQMRDVLFGDQ